MLNQLMPLFYLLQKSHCCYTWILVSKPEEIHSQNFHKRIEELNSIPNGKNISSPNKMATSSGTPCLDPMGLKAIEHIVRLTIAVHPGHEEKGIGEQLLTHLIDWGPQIRPSKIELNVRSCNTRAIRLYQKLGFNVEGRIAIAMRISDNEFVDDLEMGLFVKNTETFYRPWSILLLAKSLAPDKKQLMTIGILLNLMSN